jgi:hypothetical protein
VASVTEILASNGVRLDRRTVSGTLLRSGFAADSGMTTVGRTG